MSGEAPRIGTKCLFTPIGMWGHYVWQNTYPCIVTGIRKPKKELKGLYYDIRISQVGYSSVGDDFTDHIISAQKLKAATEKEGREWYQRPLEEFSIGYGWVKFLPNNAPVYDTPLHELRDKYIKRRKL